MRRLLAVIALSVLAGCAVEVGSAPRPKLSTSTPSIVVAARSEAPSIVDGYTDGEILSGMADACVLIVEDDWRMADFVALLAEDEDASEMGRFLRLAVDRYCPSMLDDMKASGY